MEREGKVFMGVNLTMSSNWVMCHTVHLTCFPWQTKALTLIAVSFSLPSSNAPSRRQARSIQSGARFLQGGCTLIGEIWLPIRKPKAVLQVTTAGSSRTKKNR